jgi:hypothetical protein
MNEKIKLLGEQAIHYAASRPMPELKDRDLYLDNLFEKFAELIVEECVSNLRLNGYDDAAETIVKHFGEENDN